MKIRDCPKCVNYLMDDYDAIMEACASVGMSRGKSANDMAVFLLSVYHDRGHQDWVVRDDEPQADVAL